MEYINGEFYMVGCDSDDPSCIHTAEELAALIRKIGFLPLFSNEIPGFSVEERTEVHNWWSGDPEKDPWEWRWVLGGRDDIAYGKFFNKKAGYVSKEWFPVFANYRRNGYDFDALVGDELASHRARKIMTALELDEELSGLELLSPELKEKAGFGKNGEKNYEGVLTELQMQTFLLVNDFRQKINKKGQPYGWHIAALTTPETKWGYDYIAEGYKEQPVDSWEKIRMHIQELFPDVNAKHIHKVMGIRYPGEVKTKKRKKNEIPYPENLLAKIGVLDEIGTVTEDHKEGLLYALEILSEAGREVLAARYKEHMTYPEMAREFHREEQRIRTIHDRAIRQLKKGNRLPYIKEGYCGYQLRLQEVKAREQEEIKKKATIIGQKAGISKLSEIKIADMYFSIRLAKLLQWMNFQTLEDLVMHLLKETKKDRLFKPRDQREIESKLQEFKIKLPE